AADVTDAAAVGAAVAGAVAARGPITAFLHGAGRNEPRPIRAVDAAALRATLAPKVDGARHVLAALDPRALRVFVAFGSIIARTGLHGEADYAVANEQLARLVAAWKAENPACLCSCM